MDMKNVLPRECLPLHPFQDHRRWQLGHIGRIQPELLQARRYIGLAVIEADSQPVILEKR